MPHTFSRTRQPRRGISLIEVLISIFIISIGLLGVGALIPLAHYLANRGATADRAAAAGQAALREFKVRNLDNPATWRKSDGTLLSLAATDTGQFAPLELTGGKKYCIDPRALSRTLATTFPNSGTAADSLTRLSVYDGRSISSIGNAMGVLQADTTFSLLDDLVFTVVENDPTSLPTQTIENGNEKRLSARDFSWLATLVREQAGEQYTLSVAVVQGRNAIALADATAAAQMAAYEVELTATFLGSGIGGGDVTLTIGGSPTAEQTAVFTNLAPGHWIMLNQGALGRWYRILSISEINGTSRDATLAGRDWPVNGAAKAAVLANVIGVYERTVRLKTDSLWQP